MVNYGTSGARLWVFPPRISQLCPHGERMVTNLSVVLRLHPGAGSTRAFWGPCQVAPRCPHLPLRDILLSFLWPESITSWLPIWARGSPKEGGRPPSLAVLSRPPLLPTSPAHCEVCAAVGCGRLCTFSRLEVGRNWGASPRPVDPSVLVTIRPGDGRGDRREFLLSGLCGWGNAGSDHSGPCRGSAKTQGPPGA